jgi:exonuclease SbcD
MKILHTSDWHLGKRLDDVSRHEEQAEVLEEICRIAETHEVDVVLIAGDLFDNATPPTESMEVFYRCLKRLSNGGKRAVIAIAGNHDSPDRIESPDPLARECGIIFAGWPDTSVPLFSLHGGLSVLSSEAGFIELKTANSPFPLRLLITPYASELRLKTRLGTDNPDEDLRNILQSFWKNHADTYCNQDGVNVLLSHLFVVKKGGEIYPEPEEEKSIAHVGGAQAIYSENIPEAIQYTALGHLHSLITVDQKPAPVMYSGSPLMFSFGDRNPQKYVLLVDIMPGQQAVVHPVPLCSGKKLIRLKANSTEEAMMLLQENTEALVELTLISDTFVTAEDRRRLNAMHQGIISIIPQLGKDPEIARAGIRIDLSKTTEQLFLEYFEKSRGQKPNDQLLDLFNEILAEEETPE